MKNLIKLEEISLFILSIFLFTQLDFSWWWFPLFLLAPDIGMLGYSVNNKTGAIIYNIVHHRALAIGLYIIGAMIDSQVIQFTGIILFAHATIDRVFDYGFKYFDDFKHTHLTETNSEI